MTNSSEIGINDYEKLRRENILRNEQFLSQLGLNDLKTELQVPIEPTRKTTKSKRKRPIEPNYDALQHRRSTRLRNPKLEVVDSSMTIKNELNDNEFYDDDECLPRISKINVEFDDDSVKRNKVTPPGLRIYIDQMNKEHSERISNEAIIHCLDRLNTLSNKRLATRIKSISGGKGEQSKEKMLAFYYALLAAGLLELAESAKKALQNFGLIDLELPSDL